MRLRLLAAGAAVLVFAGLAPAQRFDAYTTSVGGQAGQYYPGDTLFYPGLKLAGPTGPVTPLPVPATWYGFAYCLSSTANTAGGYIYSPTGVRLAAVWELVDGEWVLDRTADFTPRGYFFSFPYAAYNDGSVLMMGYTYSGRVEYFVW